MITRFLARAIFVASVPLFAGMAIGCGGRSPIGPTPSATTAALAVLSLFPTSGPTGGATQVTIFGAGFQSGATVKIDGIPLNVSAIAGTAIAVTTEPHAAGIVDVVVTNPQGESARVAGGYTFVLVPPPSVRTVSPNAGSTGGGYTIRISGGGFQAGAKVTLDGVEKRAFVLNSTTIVLSPPAHAAGTVDVVVTNLDGLADRLAGGFTYAPPEALDFNGDWAGGAGGEWEIPLRFTIRDNLLVRVSCGTASDITFAPSPAVSNGEFSVAGNGGPRITGRILSAVYAEGTIDLAPCGSTTWFAEKQ